MKTARPILAACLLTIAAGCATPPPTDATAQAIDRTEGRVTSAAQHVDGALELNTKMQRDLEALRQAGGAK